jgi:hypothetical protein
MLQQVDDESGIRSIDIFLSFRPACQIYTLASLPNDMLYAVVNRLYTRIKLTLLSCVRHVTSHKLDHSITDHHTLLDRQHPVHHAIEARVEGFLSDELRALGGLFDDLRTCFLDDWR